MPLNKVNYIDNQTIISAQNMNDIQDEIIHLGNCLGDIDLILDNIIGEEDNTEPV